jgi:sterol desaturase/sphingolipid hydroxylase (fatty acid hydroxylase superfamily)
MTHIATVLSPFRPVAATFLAPSSNCSIWSLGAALAMALGWLAVQRLRRGRRLRFNVFWRALFPRRVLLHRSTRADIVYCVLSLMALGAILGWAVVSTRWVSDGVAAFLAGRFGERAPAGPMVALDAGRTLALFLAYDLGFFIDHTLKHRIPALWELHKTHHSAEVLTPLVNFRVHPLDSLILANTLSLFIGVVGGAATWLLGRRATSFLVFDDNVLMVLYIYLTAQLQHTQIWIPFTGLWGRVFMSPAHHQLHHSADPAHFNCNMGASLALWDWLAGSLRPPPARSPRLKYGAQGFDHDPHGPVGLVAEPAIKFLAALAPKPIPRPQRRFSPAEPPAGEAASGAPARVRARRRPAGRIGG